ncbi:hypothetical protein K3495_g4167 [Podosphaera aphanis]|nr:hypothetical protein K3495_g4167 [Podosphaera aphanis]
MSDTDSDLHERLKASLWHKIGSLVASETLQLSEVHHTTISATPQFIGALTEMVWAQIENVAVDVEAFAHHAGRSTVSTEDVLLMARRNQALEGLLRNWVEEEAEREKETEDTTRRVGGGSKGKGKGGKRN